jgi:F0F1-type ATP synthase assembly protein I
VTPVLSDENPGRNKASSGFATARRICAWQLAIGIAGSLLWGLHGGMHAAVAGLSGGLIAVISTFYFALRAFGHGQDATPERLLGSLLRAEVMKWGVTLALFMVAIVLFRDTFPPVISVYATCLLVYWFALGWTTTTSETDTEKGN